MFHKETSLNFYHSLKPATRIALILGSLFFTSLVCSAQDDSYFASASDKQSERRWLSHITRDGGGFETSIHVSNPTLQETSVTIRGYLATGTPIGTHTLEISAMADRTLPLALFFEDQKPSHLEILGDTPAVVNARYRLADSDGLSAHLSESANPGRRFTLRMGEPDQVFDGLVIVNTGDAPVTVIATIIDQNRDEIAQVLTDGLSASGKAVIDLSSRFDDAENASILIEADGPIVVNALRGSRPGSDTAVLFANPIHVVE